MGSERTVSRVYTALPCKLGKRDSAAVQAALEELTREVGGYTTWTAQGGWFDGQEVHTEISRVVEVVHEGDDKGHGAVYRFALEMKRALKQQAVLVVHQKGWV